MTGWTGVSDFGIRFKWKFCVVGTWLGWFVFESEGSGVPGAGVDGLDFGVGCAVLPGFLEILEFAEGAVELALVGGFVAEGVGDGMTFVAAEGAEGDGGAHGGGGVGVFGHFAFHVHALDEPGAHLTPASDGDILDEGELWIWWRVGARR